ncbi:MAG: 3-deoxy-manno-octulosonate cytidylyltransferase [Candidatus Kapaibacterium sp.]
MRALAVIPARYASTRFPGKPLVDLCGATMIERVVRAAEGAEGVTDVLVATDDDRVRAECDRIRVRCVMTDPELPSGTDRVAAAAAGLKESYDIVLNVQGDEPLLQPSLLTSLVHALASSSDDVCTPVTRLVDPADLDNPTICKVTRRTDGTAMYFSRSVIPHVRGASGPERLHAVEYWKHIGLYAYTSRALQRFISLPPHPYELAESLEQLRLLADGARYLCVETDHTLIAVDTPEDADKVREVLTASALRA